MTADEAEASGNRSLPALDRTGSDRWRPAGRTVGFLLCVLAWGALYGYARLAVGPGEPVVAGLVLSPIDWPFGVALLFVGWYAGVPILRDPRPLFRYWAHVRTDRLALGATVVLVVFAIVGLFGPSAIDLLEAWFDVTAAQGDRAAADQPPLGVTVPVDAVETCAGRVVDGACHGSVSHPLGTNEAGDDVLEGVVEGTRVALAISLTTAVFIVPVAVAVGVTAAYLGGWVDTVAMRAADLLTVLPAVFVYVLVQVPLDRTLWLMVLVFGLLSWGRLARLVRNEARRVIARDYVRAARLSGGGPAWVVRTHVLPNVAGPLLVALSFFMPTMILVEVTLGWLNLSSGYVHSWGDELGVASGVFAGTFPVDGLPVATWWTEAFTLVALVSTVVSFYLVGDALRDLFDPRFHPADEPVAPSD